MKKLTLILCSLAFSYGVFSQQWETVTSNDQITIFQKEINYERNADDIDHQRIIFKYQNHTDSPIQITFTRELNYGGKIHHGDSGFTLIVPASGTVQYDNSKERNNAYFIFKKDNKGYIKSTLDSFKIINLKVEKQ